MLPARRDLAVAAFFLGLLACAPPALGETLTVRLRAADGTAVAGATAAVVASSACSPAGAERCAAAGKTDAAGETVLDGLVGTATYTATASAPGYGVARRTGLATGATASVEIAPTASPFTALGVFGGANGGLYADGAPGVFYARSTQVPQLYRTVDWGGTWQPVSSIADAAQGLAMTGPIGRDVSVATSGYPGEVAVVVGSEVHASHDFGLSWAKVAGTPAGPDVRLAWGHAGATSVLVATAGDHQQLADMTAAAPAFAPMATDYARAADGKALAVANGVDQPYVAVADATGTVKVFALTSAGTPGAEVATATGFPGAGGDPPLLVGFGGAAPASGPPSAISVATATQVGASVKATADAAYPAASVAAGECATSLGGAIGPGGSFTRESGAAAGSGAGNLNGCWLVVSAGALTVHPSAWPSFAIDAGWGLPFGGVPSRVTLQGGARGPIKSVAVDGAGVPVFDIAAEAGAGVGSGGLAIRGITAPTVTGQAFGPGAPGRQASVLRPGAGGVGYASADGGLTSTVASGVGGWAVDWFTGAGGSWLVFGTPAGSSHVLTALRDWTAATPPANVPNVAGAQAGDNTLLLDGSGLTAAEVVVTALAGAPGTDLLFAGLGDGSGGALRRLRLAAAGSDVTASDVVRIGDGQIVRPVRSLAYCPASGSAAALADVLLVATGTAADGGGLWRVTGATGATPATAQVASVPAAALVHEVRAHCASGTAWAGTNDPAASLFKSTDGGKAFAGVAHGRPGAVTAIGLNPARAAEVLVGVGGDGAVEQTLNGGKTWALVNDPATGHDFSGAGIADLLVPPATGLRAFGGLTAKDVLVAGAGVYAATLRTAAGGGAAGGKGPDRTRPVVKRFSVTPKTFAVARGATAISARKTRRGTTFRFRLSERARVRIVLTLVTVGYVKGKRCVAKRPASKRKPRYCTRYVAAGALKRARLEGAVKLPFSGRMGRRPLRVGPYRARLTATDRAGNRSQTRTQHFRVVAK